MRPTLFEFAGGEAALLELARAHHVRCLADPVLNHPFSHPDQHPQHVERLAAYWAEVLGGPPRFSQSCSDQSAVVSLHSGNGELVDVGRRFLDCFLLAMDDAGLPADPAFRAAMRTYMEAAVAEMIAYPDSRSAVPEGLPMPVWSWDSPADSTG